MEKYFLGILDIEAAKVRFRELAKQYHPDCGGSVEIMKEINSQYDEVLQGHFQREGKSITEIEKLLKDSQEVRNKLCEIINFPGVVVELCGEWIWVSGETKVIKETLKTAGFLWSRPKSSWYWRPETHRSFKRFKREALEMDVIRVKYGSEKIHSLRGREAIA